MKLTVTHFLSSSDCYNRQQIKNPETRQISPSEHLDNCSKDNNKFMVIPFYKVKRDDEDKRKTMEAHFISKFTPKLNK